MTDPILDEFLLTSRDDRLAILPIKYPEFWALYKKAQASSWTAEELKFTDDLKDWEKLDDNTKLLVETMLAFFSGADAIVNVNLAENFSRIIPVPEVKFFYGFQTHIENVHNEVYSLMIENLVRDPIRRKQLLAAHENMEGVAVLYDWAKKWIVRSEADENIPDDVEYHDSYAKIYSFAKKVVAFACVEGIMFSGPFAIIFWLKDKGILPGLTHSNELISRDEGLHMQFACAIFRNIKNKPPADQILDIIKDAVKAEQEFISTCLIKLTGMSRTDMFQYIEFVADVLLILMGYQKHWNVECPFPFMEKISFSGLTNFFERRVAEYGLAGFDGPQEILLSDEY
jgi:ribonucleotide reductase beta subunit family protein with ferritin-like domain